MGDVDASDNEADAEGARPKRVPTKHPSKRLTTPAVNAAGPGRHADGGGLDLEVDPSGAKRWVLRTVVHGGRRYMGLGGLSWVTLPVARDTARRLRKVARAGGDPMAERDKEKRRSITVEEAARKVHAAHIWRVNRNAKATAHWLSSLEACAFPKIGKRPVLAADQANVLRALGPIWIEKPETARRVKRRIRTMLDWARANGMGEGARPVDGLTKALPRQTDEAEHHAALPWRDLPSLMRRIEAVEGHHVKARVRTAALPASFTATGDTNASFSPLPLTSRFAPASGQAGNLAASTVACSPGLSGPSPTRRPSRRRTTRASPSDTTAG